MTHIVIGVQNPGDVLSQVSIQDGLDVATNINCGTAAEQVSVFLSVPATYPQMFHWAGFQHVKSWNLGISANNAYSLWG